MSAAARSPGGRWPLAWQLRQRPLPGPQGSTSEPLGQQRRRRPGPCKMPCGLRAAGRHRSARRLGAWPGHAAASTPSGSSPEYQPQQGADREHAQARRAAWIEQAWRQIWDGATQGPGSPIEHWLRVRGIDPGALDLDRLPLRWAPRCPLGTSTAHAMVALMTDAVTGATWASTAPSCSPTAAASTVEQPRMMLGTAGIVRLSPDEDVTLGLGICEGIETGLSLMAAGWRPIWAAGSLEAVRRFPVCPASSASPSSRIRAARNRGRPDLRKRWADAGREAVLWIPESGDWNDALGKWPNENRGSPPRAARLCRALGA